MNRSGTLRRVGLGSLIALIVVLAPRGDALSDPRTAASSCGWDALFAPNGPVFASNALGGVSAVSTTDAWAVGSTAFEGEPSIPLAMRWNGLEWRLVRTPLHGGVGLSAVDAFASDDAWAVGRFYSPAGGYRPVAVHWDGAAWTQTPVPVPEPNGGVFVGVDAIAPDDVWAVGYRQDAILLYQTLTAHWDGRSWRIISSVDVGLEQQLTSVSGTSATDVWAAGWTNVQGNRALIEHWDGTEWRRVPSDDQNAQVELNGVAAISADDAWAVGQIGTGYGGAYAEHWDGSRWAHVLSPKVHYGLNAVAAGGPDGVVMVGNHRDPGLLLTETWDGTSLQLDEGDGYGTEENPLYAVDVLPSGKAFAVGNYYSDDGRYYNGAYLGSC